MMDSSVKPKNLTNALNHENLHCSWVTIQVGWELWLLSMDDVHKFALNFSESHPDVINQDIR